MHDINKLKTDLSLLGCCDETIIRKKIITSRVQRIRDIIKKRFRTFKEHTGKYKLFKVLLELWHDSTPSSFGDTKQIIVGDGGDFRK